MESSDSAVVMKFGGAAVSSPERFTDIAQIIKLRFVHVRSLVVVVSAMGGTTDSLLELARQVHPQPPSRELDMLVSVGERISISLLAMALARIDVEAVSFTGSQSGILTDEAHTNAKIIDVRPQRILKALRENKIAIVAGFQGMSRGGGDITTLGRGGSDTTAVAIAAALKAKQVEFYKDVDGVFDLDPKSHESAKKFPSMTYSEALKLTQGGAKILHSRCIEIAEKNHIPLWVRSFSIQDDTDSTSTGTWIRSAHPVQKSEHENSPIYEQIIDN
jgi:aspartate kinase